MAHGRVALGSATLVRRARALGHEPVRLAGRWWLWRAEAEDVLGASEHPSTRAQLVVELERARLVALGVPLDLAHEALLARFGAMVGKARRPLSLGESSTQRQNRGRS